MKDLSAAVQAAAMEHVCASSPIFLIAPRIAPHEVLGFYVQRIADLSSKNAAFRIGKSTLGYQTLINPCLPANLAEIVRLLGDAVPMAGESRRLHTLYPLTKLAGTEAVSERLDSWTMTGQPTGDRFHFARRSDGITWAPGICPACVRDDDREHTTAVWHREHLLRLSNICALHGEQIYEPCGSCLHRLRRTTRLPAPALSCACARESLVARRPPVSQKEWDADYGLSHFVFEFLNSTDFEQMNGPAFANAVSDRLAELSVRREMTLHRGRLQDCLAASLSKGALATLPDPRRCLAFSRALRGQQPFFDASTALTVAYALFGSIEKLREFTSSERAAPIYRSRVLDKVRRRGELLTPTQRQEVTLSYLERLGIPADGVSNWTRGEIRARAKAYVLTWLVEYGDPQLLREPAKRTRLLEPNRDTDAIDAKQAAAVKAKASDLRNSGYPGRISKNILLYGLTGGHNGVRRPRTREALEAEVESRSSWHIRTTQALLLHARRAGVPGRFIPTTDEVAQLSIAKHNQLRALLKKKMAKLGYALPHGEGGVCR